MNNYDEYKIFKASIELYKYLIEATHAFNKLNKSSLNNCELASATHLGVKEYLESMMGTLCSSNSKNEVKIKILEQFKNDMINYVDFNFEKINKG